MCVNIAELVIISADCNKCQLLRYCMIIVSSKNCRISIIGQENITNRQNWFNYPSWRESTDELLKCSYIRKLQVAGTGFWEYFVHECTSWFSLLSACG